MNRETSEILDIVIYYSFIYKIGGIEAWIFYLCQHLYKYYNITVLFDNGNIDQLKRINQYVNVEKVDKLKTYHCNTLLMATYLSKCPDNFIYNNMISCIHSDYKNRYSTISDKNQCKESDKIISVSERASQSLKDLCNKDSIIIPNILGRKEKTHHILHLVSFTRLTREKGYDRMCLLIKELKENNIKFDWKIFSDIDDIVEINKIQCPEVIFMKPTLDTFDYINDADYLVQLSDTEAFCYSVHEALQYGTAVLVTDIEVFKDVVIDGYNGYKFKLDMSNVDVNNIAEKIPKDFIYNDKSKEVENAWFKVLGEPSKSNKINKDNEIVKVKALEAFHDLERQRDMKANDVIEVSKLRAYELCTCNNKMGRKICKEI